jgi:shikimate kinase
MELHQQSNLVLIGMPGSGKSTAGIILAENTLRDFVDTDDVIVAREGRSLQQIVDEDGQMALRQIEEDALLATDLENHVISTGGSAVYGDDGMMHLKSNGTVVFIHIGIPTLLERLTDLETRGIAKRPDQTFEDLFGERFVLYQRYADVCVDGDGLSPEEVCELIEETLKSACQEVDAQL